MSLLAAAALTIAPTIAPALPAADTASEYRQRYAVCARQAARTGIPVHGAWNIRCVDSINNNPRVKGLTVPATRTIYLKATSNPAAARRIATHELSHAYSLDVLSPAAQQWFAAAIGRPSFFRADTYALRPTEIWANSQARCAGNGIPGQVVVSCAVLAKATTVR